jgi:hypothetical protein
VYNRKVNGKTLTLAPSGWTYHNIFVLYDRETNSMWYPFKEGLMSIQGKYFKKWLREYPSDDTRWSKWKRRYPDSKILE